MKKILLFSLLAAILLTICGCGSLSSKFGGKRIPESPVADFQYEIEDGEVKITKYIGSDREVRIPAEIKDRPVTVIGRNAFKEYDLLYIYIPENVVLIDESAFYCCRFLETVVLPESLRDIGDGAFSGCEALKKIEIPRSVTALKYGTFQNCTSLNSVKLYENLLIIECDAFENCKMLTEIKLPDRLRTIEAGAFEGCDNLKELHIPAHTRIEVEYKKDVRYNGEDYFFCASPFYIAAWRQALPEITTVLVVKENSYAHQELLNNEGLGINFKVQ